MDKNYYRSERFIWDNLKVNAATGITSLYKSWRQKGRVEPFAISWPSETILDDSGLPLQGSCLIDLPSDHAQWNQTLVKFVGRTKSYALLLAEQLPREIRVILESHHGTRSWVIPILISGDIRTLGTASIHDNVHKIGILWKGKKTPS